MKKLLVTLNIGDYDKEITELTFPYMREYAKNIGADFYIITERKFPDFPLMLEEFQMYEFSETYDWIIFLDGDCLINPKGVDLTTLVEKDRVLIAKYNSPTHHFHPENIEGQYNFKYYAPFFFLVFHRNSRNCVKPYENPFDYYEHINLNSTHPEMKTYMEIRTNLNEKEIKDTLIDEFLLTLNLHRYNIKTASLVEDFPELNIITHISNARDIKIQHLKNSIKQIKKINSISYL
jgi:hypothetical protein